MVLAVQSESKSTLTTTPRVSKMNASTLVICRDEIDPLRVRISGTNADHLVLFSDTIPLALLKEILARMDQYPAATVRLKAEGNHWRRQMRSSLSIFRPRDANV
jgi:hypothetical protein